MTQREDELKDLLALAREGLNRSRKIMADLKRKLNEEDTIAIGYKISIQKLEEALRITTLSIPKISEGEQRELDTDIDFKKKLDELMKKV